MRSRSDSLANLTLQHIKPIDADDFGLITVYKSEDGWWFATHSWDSNRLVTKAFHKVSYEDLPEYIHDRLAVLLVADVEFSMDGIGRRVGERSFWLYVSKKEVEDAQQRANL